MPCWKVVPQSLLCGFRQSPNPTIGTAAPTTSRTEGDEHECAAIERSRWHAGAVSNSRRFRRTRPVKPPEPGEPDPHRAALAHAIAKDAERMRRDNPAGYRRQRLILRAALAAAVAAILVWAVLNW